MSAIEKSLLLTGGKRARMFAVPAIAAMLASGVPVANAAPPRPPTATTPGRTPTAPLGPGAGGELSGDEGGHNTCKRQPPGTKFRLTLPKEAELQDLVNWMMSVSCQKFIYSPTLRTQKVTILSPEAVTLQEAYAAFYAALETMGATVEPSGEYFRIVETTNVNGKTLPVYGPDGRAPSNARFVTQLYRASGNVAEVADLFEKLKSQTATIQTVGDLIIITDTGTNVQRMLQIVRQIDDPELASEKVYFFQLQYANPEETAETIRQIFGEKDSRTSTPASRNSRNRNTANAAAASGGEDGASFSRVVIDERTGTLIIVSREEDYQVIRRLIEQLDVPLGTGGGRIHVVKLKNADPEEVAQVLTQLGTGAQAAQRGAAGGRGQQPGGAQAQQGGTTAELFSGDIKVTADPATRSLVILSSTNDFNALRNVIDELDVERKSVYIEVYLLELNVGKVWEGGARGHFGSPVATPGGDAIGFVANSPGGRNAMALDSSILTGLAAGILGPQIPNSGALLGLPRDIPAFGVIIQALQTNTDVNFVAQPHLFTADNQEAVIEVGRQVPTPGALTFPGGGQGGGLVPVQSIQRQDVTLRVQVTPHINDADMVTLDIEMENNDIESTDPVRGVTTTKRRLKLDKVLARDDQPVVLGGLMQEVERETSDQVPGLGSIPLLGWLFKHKRKERVKVNMMMILVPHILETPDDVRRIHEQRMRERLEFLERYTAFKRKDLDLNINYRKKAGLLAAINQEASRMIDEEAFRRQADLELQRQDISGEIGLSPRAYEEEAATTNQTGPGTPPTAPVPRQRPQQNRVQ